MITDGVGALPARAELRLPAPALLAARRRPGRGRGHLARRRVAVAEVRGAEARPGGGGGVELGGGGAALGLGDDGVGGVAQQDRGRETLAVGACTVHSEERRVQI